ncbi:hypothetical protein GCM10028774_23670 [Spirosoma jeollabukense]
MQATFAILLVLSLGNYAVGQTARVDSSFVGMAKNQAIDLYERSLKLQSHVYEGNQYINHDPRIQVHPYYLTDTIQAGSVNYRGVLYRNVNMLYDINRDELAIQPPDGGYRLTLHTDKIAAFSLGKHQFTRLVEDSVAGIRTGFYEIIYNGTVKALAKRLKTVYEDISSGAYKADYLQKDSFVIQKDGAFFEVKTKKSVLDLFPDQAKVLKKFVRANRLKFKDDSREQTIIRITQRYDELTH